MKKIKIRTDYITLGQFLKFVNVVESGGMVKLFLSEFRIKINNQLNNQRGKKIYPGDIVEIEDVGVFLVNKKQ